MDEQLTFRLPPELAKLLARKARERRVSRAMLVREAIAAYLTGSAAAPNPVDPAARLAPFLGALRLDRARIERDALASRIREQNWRE